VIESQMYMVIVHLDQPQPQPPVWVRATSRDDARDQVTELINFGTGRWHPEGVRMYVYDESAVGTPLHDNVELRRAGKS